MIFKNLNPEKALIWRIVHRDNLPWVLAQGLDAIGTGKLAEHYVGIGNPDLISKRSQRTVQIDPGGTLADYVPFYFTPFSVMMKNIHSGWGVQQRRNEEIVILVSSLYHLQSMKLGFIFTDAHAYPDWTGYYSDLKHLDKIDWGLLQNRDFKRDPDDPRKMERYQAEALIHGHVPVAGLLGVVCYNEAVKRRVDQEVQKLKLNLPVHARPGWYF
ncbi:type II toxin-antitoxin system toxin DNA ADP-ribosyl transferase DarT [Pseudomonas sp. NPDC089554]|uniref:type II toxin-antitoxin system toxin DNA ADP-ribosyl transferase DarT n=1 Tax=Pseudomonas sp. NPDC089554 TaxID=3390653 RepID=UPI003D00AAD2